MAIAVSLMNRLFMSILSKRLRERAKQLGISNAEAARRVGLEERRYAHYASGRREPDLATLKSISETLGTTPNWLLGVPNGIEGNPEKSALVNRLVNSANLMDCDEVKLLVVQAEAIAARNK